MGVTATDQSDALASFGNDGKAVLIAAPGVDIQTVDTGGAYTVINGTSASAAYIAGGAAVMKAVDQHCPEANRHPQLSNENEKKKCGL